jgi:hypothetical protein
MLSIRVISREELGGFISIELRIANAVGAQA